MNQSIPPIAARTVEKYGRAVRTYERVKLLLLVAVLIVNLGIAWYLVGVGRGNQESLVILRCAIAREVRVDAHGKPRTQPEMEKAFDACVKRGHPLTP